MANRFSALKVIDNEVVIDWIALVVMYLILTCNVRLQHLLKVTLCFVF